MSSIWSVAIRAMPSVLLSGCAFAPSIPLFGAAFPDWLFCIVGGIAGTVVAHIAMSRLGAESALAPFFVSYPALSALLAMAAWLVLFFR